MAAAGSPNVAGGVSTDEAARKLEAARERGGLLYRIRCAACHGVEARGDGPLATDLTTPPADLTRLRRSDEAEFPATRLRVAMDGRQEVRGHGSREMPVWGLAFQEEGRVGSQEAEVRDQIDDLLAFLETIQESDSVEPD